MLLGLKILLPGHLSILLCHIISMEKFSIDMVYSEASHLVRLLSTMVPRLFAIDCLQAIHYQSICKWYKFVLACFDPTMLQIVPAEVL
jgi:hypothetical protein